MNLRPIDYEDGGESGKPLLRGRIVRSFLDADFRFAARPNLYRTVVPYEFASSRVTSRAISHFSTENRTRTES